jgi:hypothetical protein
MEEILCIKKIAPVRQQQSKSLRSRPVFMEQGMAEQKLKDVTEREN